MVSQRPARECVALVDEMIDSMRHESFYISGTSHAPEQGVYGGWIAHQGSFAAVESKQAGDVSVLFSGECYADERQEIAEQYRERGARFIRDLNGIFSGVIIDHARGAALLFNDRYGLDRIYVAEEDGDVYFASEAKALLRVRPATRTFSTDGVADFLTFGCTTGNRTLFKGVELLPAGSVWTIERGGKTTERYFAPAEWENQEPLGAPEFERAFAEAVEEHAPKYFSGGPTDLGMSLTAGLDSRVVMAACPSASAKPLCYTYEGPEGETLDGRLAAQVAAAAGCSHQLVRLGSNFFSNFADAVERTVQLTDGTLGLIGAHEAYLSSAARDLAPVRLTGVFGGEIFRGVSTFKPLGLDRRLFDPSLAKQAEKQRDELVESDSPVTRAAFQEIPWNIFGSIAACRSQLSFRTPYLDNAIVSLAYRKPPGAGMSDRSFESFIRKTAPALASIPTDMGLLGAGGHLAQRARKASAKAMFKFEYLRNDGMPHWLAFAEPILQPLNSPQGALPQHKYLRYRRWLQRELADYVREALRSNSVRQNSLWKKGFVESLAEQHISGRANFLQEINAVLTLDAVERCLFKSSVAEREAAPVYANAR